MKRRTLCTSLLMLGSSFFAGSIVAAEFSDQAQVTSVRAVFGSAPQTRCWVDREQIREERRGDANVPGAVVGGNVGRDDRGDRYSERAVQRCEQVPSSGQPDYWDVEYSYGGQVFNTQLNYAPGPQIPVRVSVEPE